MLFDTKAWASLDACGYDVSVQGILRVLAGVLVASSGTILGSVFGIWIERFNYQYTREEVEVKAMRSLRSVLPMGNSWSGPPALNIV